MTVENSEHIVSLVNKYAEKHGWDPNSMEIKDMETIEDNGKTRVNVQVTYSQFGNKFWQLLIVLDETIYTAFEYHDLKKSS